MTSCYGYVSASSIFHMHLTSYDYNVRHMHISSHIEQTITFSYISKSFPAINGLNKYIANLSPTCSCTRVDVTWIRVTNWWLTSCWQAPTSRLLRLLECWLHCKPSPNSVDSLTSVRNLVTAGLVHLLFLVLLSSFKHQSISTWGGVNWSSLTTDLTGFRQQKRSLDCVIWSEYQQTFRVQSPVMVPPLQYMQMSKASWRTLFHTLTCTTSTNNSY